MHRVQNAVFSIFPTTKSLDDFIQQENGLKLSKLIINWAYSNKLIQDNDTESFCSFIGANINERNDNILDEVESFSYFIENLSEFIKFEGTIAKLVDTISNFLKQNKIEITKIDGSNITRLKQGNTSNAQKNTLRALSLWIGYEKPEYGLLYNYENLLNLCTNKINKEDKWDKKEGCRIALGLFSRGDLIDNKIVEWLTDKIDEYKNDFKAELGSVEQAKAYNTTTLCIDFFKKNDENKLFYHPITFGKCINKAISLSYKLMISWLLSDYNTSRRFLFIGIAAGTFSDHDFYSHIQGILSEDIPNDPIIRLTDFTRQCVVMNDIRVLTCQTPKEKLIASGEIIKVWWLEGLWNTLYWDFIPDMIKDDALLSDEKLRNLLWVSRNQKKQKKNENNAIVTFFKSKQNTLLGLEIAKTLFYRKKFIEAGEIVRIILIREPKNIIARTLKISILWNKGVTSDTYSKSELYFKSLEKEAEYIDEYCENRYEDHYCEYALGVLGHATTIIRFVKKGFFSFEDVKNKIIKLLNKTESIFEKAKNLSPTGSRSVFLLLYTRSLKNLIINDKNFPCDSFNSKTYLQKNHKIFDTITNEMFSLIGWLHPDLKDPKEKLLFYEDRAYEAIKLHDDSTFLRSYTPGVLFCYAAILWDFNPFITKQTINTVIEWLKQSKLKAEKLKGKNLCIYSATKFNGENMTIETFLSHINKCISELTKIIKKKELPEDEYEIIDDVSFKGLKLCLLNFYD